MSFIKLQVSVKGDTLRLFYSQHRIPLSHKGNLKP